MGIKIRNILIILTLFLQAGCDFLYSKDIDSVKKNKGDISENIINCQALNNILSSDKGKALYVHGWETQSDDDATYVYFIAGFEPFPQKEWLVLVWRIEIDAKTKQPKVTYMPKPNAGVEYLRKKNLNDTVVPAGPMEKVGNMDMCQFKNMDGYRGETDPVGAMGSMKESVIKWSDSIKLPYRNMMDYLRK